MATDRALRRRPVEGAFALTRRENNTERLACVNAAAEAEGLVPGMGVADARAMQPNLRTRPSEPEEEQRFLLRLARWAGRYCPWVGLEGGDGLVLDISGSAHLFGGEAAMLADLRARLGRAGITVRTGLGDTRGAAWALARFAEGVALPGEAFEALAPLPIAALRLPAKTCAGLERVGVRTISTLADLPRASTTRRFGGEPMLRLDQALGRQAEEVSPLPEPVGFSVRLTLPEPIGLTRDVMAGLDRLLGQLCTRLAEQEKGARTLALTLRRVDRGAAQVELRLARPMRDPARLRALFEKNVDGIDAGYGIDQLRLEAVRVEPLPFTQISRHTAQTDDRLADLITRLGARVGLERIQRFLPADSHIPERSFTVAPAAFSEAARTWPADQPRPLRLFPPEPIAGHDPSPPGRFRWRAMRLTTLRATGPERIAPEWWHDDPHWRTGLRDYWRVETGQGRRLWLFHTPQAPAWFVHGEFG